MTAHAEQRRITDDAMRARPFPHLDRETIVIPRHGAPSPRHILGGLAIVAIALLAAAGCWKVP